MPRSELVQSLRRGLELLETVSCSSGGMSLKELCAATGLKKTTVHNLMRTLCFRNFVYKDKKHRFRVGSAIEEILANSVGKKRIGKAQRLMQTLAKRFPQSIITFSVLKQSDVRCLLRITPESKGIVQVLSSRCFLPYVSVSAVLLQALYPQECAGLEQQYPFEEYGAGLWVSIDNFNAAKEKIAAEGYCCRFSGNMARMAFRLPDFHVLGFNSPEPCGHKLAEYRSAAEEFSKLLWDAGEE